MSLYPIGTRNSTSLVDDPRFRHLVDRLHALGTRPVGEFIAELHRDLPIGRLLERLERHASSDPANVRALGADRWPVSIFLVGDIKSGSGSRADIMRQSLTPRHDPDGGQAA